MVSSPLLLPNQLSSPFTDAEGYLFDCPDLLSSDTEDPIVWHSADERVDLQFPISSLPLSWCFPVDPTLGSSHICDGPFSEQFILTVHGHYPIHTVLLVPRSGELLFFFSRTRLWLMSVLLIVPTCIILFSSSLVL